MKPTWILENWTGEKSYMDLADEIIRQGLPYMEVRDYKKSDFQHLQNKCIIFSGSIQMAQIMKRDLDTCSPVVWLNERNYLCSRYYSHFGNLLFNDKYALVSLSELHRQKFLFWGTFGKEASIFLRPDSGEKPFQAQLMDIQDFDKFCERNSEMMHELVLVSTPKKISGEYRFIVSSNKDIIAYSTYQYQGLVTKIPFVPIRAKQKCQEVLEKNYHPDRVYCVDICEDGDGDFWLLELNSFSSAGLYECDKTSIVKNISNIALEEFTLDKQIGFV